jgi:mgtE-like transporter
MEVIAMTIRGLIEKSLIKITPLSKTQKKFFEVFKQSLIALSVDLGGLLSGLILVFFSSFFSSVPWALVIYPGILSMRGAIGGLFSGHLSTNLHLGTIKSSLVRNTKDFYIFFYATVFLTIESGLIMGAVFSLISIYFWGFSLFVIGGMFCTLVATTFLSFLLASPITLKVSALAFNRGLDPDIIAYPIMSTVSDLIGTVIFMVILTLFFSGYIGTFLIWILFTIILFLGLSLFLLNLKEKEFIKTLKEFFLALAAVTLIAYVTGNFLGKISQTSKKIQEIYILYPAILGTVGDVGSIIGSLATTKLALGTIRTSFKSIKENIPEIIGGSLASAMWFILFSIIAHYTVHNTFLQNQLLRLIILLNIVNFIAVPIISVLAYGIAFLTFKRGLNPDNFVIPFESSLSDNITTFCLFAAISFILSF